MLASKRNILVVEDEPLLRLVLASALDDAGYSVLEAGTVLICRADFPDWTSPI